MTPVPQALQDEQQRREKTMLKIARREFIAEQPSTNDPAAMDHSWEPPATFYEHDLPEFPLDALPDRFNLFARELARETQVPADLPAILAITVAAGSVAGHAQIQARPGWLEPLCIYSIVVLPPANRKSAVFRAVCEPLEDVERDLVVAKRDEIARAASEYRMLEERKQKAEKEAARTRTDNPADRKAKAEEAIVLAQQLASARVPVTPRLIVSDVTPEQLATLMTEQDGRMCMLSPEEICLKRLPEGIAVTDRRILI